MTNDALPDFIRGLLSPEAYDHPAGRIELIQTHVSYVILAGDFAYKLKKPLDFGFLDYSTLERRKLMCEEEIRLNRRLCAEAYLGVVPVVRAGESFSAGGDGDPVEYAVKMRRMDAARMMPAMLERREVTSDHIQTLARTLAEFHREAETSERIAAYGRDAGLRFNWDENFEQTAPYVGRTVTQEQYDAVRAYVDGFLRDNAALIEQRADDGRTRDCHGDLRADAVVIGHDGSICVMDCIEFNDRIRYGDVAGDVGFLAMDLDFRGRRDLSDELIGAYIGETDDETLPLVLDFYKCYRAYVRGKVDGFQIDDPAIPAPQREAARARAAAYFELAHGYATHAHPRALLLMVGLSGSGKTYVANALAGRIGAAAVNSDALRKRLLGIAERARVWVPYATGIYTDEERQRVYAAMNGRAREHFALGRGVVLDATYIRRADREAARAVAREAGAPFLAVHVIADEASTRAHLDRRRDQPGTTSDGRWEIYLGQRDRQQPPDEFPPDEIIEIDGARPVDENVLLLEQRIAALAAP